MPEKPVHEHPINVRDATKSMQPQHRERGLPAGRNRPGQCVNQRQRVEIRHTLEARQPAQADKGRTITATAKTNVPSPAKEAGQADTTPNEMPTRVIDVTTASTPIRGFLGFPTSPDAGDL